MKKGTHALWLTAVLLAVLACLTAPSRSAGFWNEDEALMDDWTFRERKLSAVDNSS